MLCSRYLTGNPCTDFKGYRKYVIATLPQLKSLDGLEIERSERILATQEYDEVEKLILSQEQEYKGLFLGPSDLSCTYVSHTFVTQLV